VANGKARVKRAQKKIEGIIRSAAAGKIKAQADPSRLSTSTVQTMQRFGPSPAIQERARKELLFRATNLAAGRPERQPAHKLPKGKKKRPSTYGK
jgi:hypothetical protein